MVKIQSSQNEKKESSKEVIEEIYKQSFIKPIALKGLGSGKILIWALILSTLAGFLAGFIEDAWLHDYFNAPANPQNSNANLAVPDLNSFIKKEDQDYQQALSQLQKQLLGIYRKKADKDVFNSLYLDKDFLGSAVAITSDGWLLTPASLIKEGNYVIMTPNKKVLEPLKEMIDPLTKLALVKINAQDLAPARFADFNSLQAGQPVLAARYSGQNYSLSISRTALEKIAYQEQLSGKDFLLSSEELEHYLKLSRGLENSFAGAPLFNDRAEVVGLLNGAAKPAGEVHLAVPAVYLDSAVDNFLASSNQVIRPFLGVHYFDLSAALGLSEQITEGQKQGAVLFGDAENKVSAVSNGSPAEKAGLKAGDIILKVNQEAIDERNSLTKLIQDYTPGQEITLTVFKKGQTSEIKAVLGEL